MELDDRDRAMIRDNVSGFGCGYSAALHQVWEAMDRARSVGDHDTANLLYTLVYKPVSDYRPTAIANEQAEWDRICAERRRPDVKAA